MIVAFMYPIGHKHYRYITKRRSLGGTGFIHPMRGPDQDQDAPADFQYAQSAS
jgi:hypothetical protein